MQELVPPGRSLVAGGQQRRRISHPHTENTSGVRGWEPGAGWEANAAALPTFCSSGAEKRRRKESSLESQGKLRPPEPRGRGPQRSVRSVRVSRTRAGINRKQFRLPASAQGPRRPLAAFLSAERTQIRLR